MAKLIQPLLRRCQARFYHHQPQIPYHLAVREPCMNVTLREAVQSVRQFASSVCTFLQSGRHRQDRSPLPHAGGLVWAVSSLDSRTVESSNRQVCHNRFGTDNAGDRTNASSNDFKRYCDRIL